MNETTNDTTRRFSRSLREAFPASEGYRDAIEAPPPSESWLSLLKDALYWLAACILLLWLGWMALHAQVPGPL